jgi:hypothetical protein
MRESSALRYDVPIVAYPSPGEQQATPSPTPIAADRVSPALKTEVSIAVLSVSAAMVGVCLTSIGILKLVVMERHALARWCDDLLSFTSLVFLSACIASFRVIQSPTGSRTHRMAFIAETLFLIGLAMMVIACALLTWTVVTLIPQ